MTIDDFVARLVVALERAEVPYMLTGSYASSMHGVIAPTAQARAASQERRRPAGWPGAVAAPTARGGETPPGQPPRRRRSTTSVRSTR